MPKVKPPNEKQQQKINELKSLAQSFRAEIPSGRSPWPACIRDRVFELSATGMSYRQISALSAIPYDTIVAWPVRRAFTEAGFKELKVVQNNASNMGTGTVTMPTPLQHVPTKSGLVIHFRDFRIEGLTAKELIELLPLVLGSKDFNL